MDAFHTMSDADRVGRKARRRLFLPQFAKTFRGGTPWFGILVAIVVASLLMAFAYSGNTGLTVFTYLVAPSVVTVAIPYLFSACAQLAYLVSRRRKVHGSAMARDLAIAITSVLFSMWVAFTAGYQAVYQAMLLLLIGIPIYASSRRAASAAATSRNPLSRPTTSFRQADTPPARSDIGCRNP